MYHHNLGLSRDSVDFFHSLGFYPLRSFSFMLAGFGGTALVFVASFCSPWEQIRVNFALSSLRKQPGSYLMPYSWCWMLTYRTHSYSVWAVLRIGNTCEVQVLIYSHQDTSFAVLERHIFWAIPYPFYKWGEVSTTGNNSLFCINTAFYFPQLRLCKSTTIQNRAFLLGALRQAVWCMDFWFCLE